MSNMLISEEKINKIVDFWASQIEYPVFDNGDKSQTGLMTSIMAINLVEKQPKARIEEFKKSLNHIIFRDFQDINKIRLSCDYSPDVRLSEAMTNAKIPSTNISWKTNLNVRDGEIYVSVGYAAEFKKL